MTDEEKHLFYDNITTAGINAGVLFPDYQAAEACLESNFGDSKLFKLGLNLFGQKQRKTPIYETLTMPTKEIINGQEVVVQANWIKYPDIETCLKHRIEVLTKLAKAYPDYDAALKSTNGRDFVLNVSRTWATDPNRGPKVLDIYDQYHKTENDAQSSDTNTQSSDVKEEVKIDKVPTFKDWVKSWWSA